MKPGQFERTLRRHGYSEEIVSHGVSLDRRIKEAYRLDADWSELENELAGYANEDWFQDSGITLHPEPPGTWRWYRDLPMDFTDATLVVLAEELNTQLVCTTGRRDFAVYRIHGRKKFKVKPELPRTSKRI